MLVARAHDRPDSRSVIRRSPTMRRGLRVPLTALRAAPGDLLNRISLILAIQSCLQRFFRSRRTQIKSISLAISVPYRGVSRSSRTWGGMRWTRQHQASHRMAGRADKACERSWRVLTTDAFRGRRSHVVLTPRRRRQVAVARRPGRALTTLNPQRRQTMKLAV